MYGNVTLDECLDFFYQLWETEWEVKAEKEKRMRDKFNACLDYITHRLEGRQYLCGDSVTAADCYDLYYASLMNQGELLCNHPKIQEHLARLQARPANQAAVTLT